MTIRIKRLKDGAIYTYTKVLANKKGFAVFDDEAKAPKGPISLEEMDRNDIGKYIFKKYGVQIPKLNRKKDVILAEAYTLIEAFDE